MTDFSPPRGTQDLLPPASDRLSALAAGAAELARRFGFRPVETPAFEHTELFVRGVGETTDVVTKEMYTFEDKGGRSLTLRPEGTAPVMRAYLNVQQSLPTPFKAFYVVPMFRHERPQAGRMRQHTQFGVEVIGTPGARADVEVISVAHAFLASAGLRFELLVNSIGDDTCRPAYREALLAFLEERAGRLRDEHRERWKENPLRVLDCKDEACRAATEDAPRTLDHLCDECRAHFDEVRDGLEEERIPFDLEPRLVRGLDYYTRTAFEFQSDALGPTQSTLCGGGRYDGLAETLGGPATPGIGFGLGLERVLLAAEKEGAQLPTASGGVFVVAIGGEQVRSTARSIVRWLREEGIAAQSSLEDRPLKAQLKLAGRSGAEFAAIVGEQEVDAGEVVMRRLEDGSQERMPWKEIASWLRG